MNPKAVTSDHAATLDPEHPWLGLFSYTEATRAYFHGRSEETAELARRVQHKILTVLFGQSGLGKTSLLRAGLVPRLRKEGYCPVYVRIDYAEGSPVPAMQIRQAIFRATLDAGHWTRPGASAEGDSLWELLHHRGDLLRDADGNPLTPLLIFDQFEEIFTLGQADDAGKHRANQFLEDLADLVENRAPAALEARMEEDDDAAEAFDFSRADYRVLITLREDYLAHLESIKDSMPSITQNRMRLARMSGEQALDAVIKPGGRLVTPEVAEAIVRFVAGGSELKNAEIEPSLLSLVCRELNIIRQHQHRKEISTDLLAGSRDTILSEFYERALADQPEGVRRAIEDELLTESGYRESLAEERVLNSLAAAGAAPDALATLVNRRLLRIEERLDMRRVELTHDVLCSVVLDSRNSRREREAREAGERALAAQREREAEAHRKLKRARLVINVCVVLLLIAVAGAAFGWYNMHRALAAEEHARASRTHAENLVSFLIEDFYNELAPTGRLETLGKLAQRAVTYYDSLPPELRSKQTEINRAMALVRLGSAQLASGDQKAATKSFDDAQAAFDKLRAAGHQGEAVTYGVALILYNEGNNAVNLGIGSTAPIGEAAALLKPLAEGAKPSHRVRQLYADTLNLVCFYQPPQQGLATCDEALKILEGLGALDLAHLDAAASWADTSDTKSGQLIALGRPADAQKLEEQVYAMTEKILVRRPGDLHALADRYFAAGRLAQLADGRHDATATADYADKAVQAAQDMVRFNPSDLGAWSRWTQALNALANYQFERGEITRSIATQRSALALARDPRSPKGLAAAISFVWLQLAANQAVGGDSAGADQSLQAHAHAQREAAAGLPANAPQRRLAEIDSHVSASYVKFLEGAPQAAFEQASAQLAAIEAIEVPAADANTTAMKIQLLQSVLGTGARAAVQLGRYPQAEKLARQRLALPRDPSINGNPLGKAQQQMILAEAVAMQGRHVEARKTLQPALDYYRQQVRDGAYAPLLHRDYAHALYVSAITHPTDAAGARQRKADLDEAAQQIAAASYDGHVPATARYIAGLIAKAQK